MNYVDWRRRSGEIMKNVYRTISIIIISVLLLAGIILPIVLTNLPTKKPLESILIWSDEDFQKYDFEGNGTISSPYLISNFNITTGSNEGIFISGTSKFVIIENCYVDAKTTGIKILNTADGTIKILNNYCTNNIDYGIRVVNSDFVVVQNNTCVSSSSLKTSQGISISFSKNATLEENSCYGHELYGINIDNSPFSNVTKNECFFNKDTGIVLLSSSNSQVGQNILSDNTINGLVLGLSENSTIYDNNFEETGLRIIDEEVTTYISYKITNNIANNRPLSFEVGLENETIISGDLGQIFFVNCKNITLTSSSIINSVGLVFSFCENITIEHNYITNIPSPGFLTWFCENILVQDNLITNSMGNGIILFNTKDSQVLNNTCTYNSRDGILLYGSFNNTIKDNFCNSNNRVGSFDDRDGILVIESQYTYIINNTCSSNGDDGISLYNSPFSTAINNTCTQNINRGIAVFSSNYSFISGNNCSFNNYYGFTDRFSFNITLTANFFDSNGYNGITMYGTRNTVISYNSIQDNTLYGIDLPPSGEEQNGGNNLVFMNLIANNRLHGIYLSVSYYNVIAFNAFIDNNEGGSSQAFDASGTNLWYNATTLSGNYWNEWISGNYQIDGSALAYDFYPLSSNPL